MQLWYEDFVKVDDEIWAASGIFNGLFKCNLSDKSVEFITCFNEEKILGKRLFSGIVEYEKKLYFIPFMATCFFVYDINKGKLEKAGICCDEPRLLNLCCTCESKIIMCHNSKDVILIYDVKSEEFHTIHNVKKDNSILGCYTGRGTVFDNHFYIGNSYNNVIVSIDLNNLSVSSWKAGASDDIYYVIDQLEEQLLVKNGKGDICIINPYTFEQSILGNMCEKTWTNNINDTVILMNGVIYIFSFAKPYVKQFHLNDKSNSIFCIEKEEESAKYINLFRQWGCVKKIDDMIFFNSNRDFASYFIGKQLLKTDIFLTDNRIFEYILQRAAEEERDSAFLPETPYFRLENYIKIQGSINQICAYQNCGEIIFQECIKT